MNELFFKYPDLHRDALSLRQKFNTLHASTVPTGDPQCPDCIRKAKRLKVMIEERSDATNLDEEVADIGMDPEDTGNEADVEEERTQPRRLFTQQASRPLVRTPSSTR